MQHNLTKCDSRYGAQMGRAGTDYQATTKKGKLALVGMKFHLCVVPLDSGGYDSGGAYWGLRFPIAYKRPDGTTVKATPRIYWYYVTSKDGKRIILQNWIDAVSREDAKKQISKVYPQPKFYR